MSTDKNNLVYQEQLDDNVIEMLSEDIGSNYSLRTENTKTIVAALNEILGKDIICNAVGSPLLTTDTFAQMGEKINVMVSDFKAKLLGLGVSVSSVDKLASLIEKMGEIDLGVDADELLQTYIDSLKQILIENGVEVNGNETLAELIVKVDEEFTEVNDNKQQLVDILNNRGFEINDQVSFEELVDIINSSKMSKYGIKEIIHKIPGTTDRNIIMLKHDGTLLGCGDNGYGQLGIIGDHVDVLGFIKLPIDDIKQVVSSDHTMILKNDGTLWGCGRNSYGQLGLGDTTDREEGFIQISDDVSQVACGISSTFILKNDGTLWGCGRNYYGDLGLADTDIRKEFVQIPNIDDVKQIICGVNYTLVLKNDGTLWGCGDNSDGQLGLGDTTDREEGFVEIPITDIKQLMCGYKCTFVLKNDNTLWGTGSSTKYQLGLGDTDNRTTFTLITDNVKKVSSGGTTTYNSTSGYDYTMQTMILKNDGTLWGCGRNNNGQLGLGDTSGINTLTQVTTNINNDVKDVICLDSNTYIIKNDDTIWSCGLNTYGQLGVATGTDNVRSKSNIFVEMLILY